MTDSFVVSALTKWYTVLDHQTPRLTASDVLRHPGRARWFRRWNRTWELSHNCGCSMCLHRCKGVRWQAVTHGRYCGCGHCPIDGVPDCSTKEWQYVD